jgi:glycosyltransferase involved in cell wall biosynthesis
MTEVRVFDSTPLEYYGGGEVVAISIARGLLAQGFEVNLVSDSSAGGVSRLPPERVVDLTKGLHHDKVPFCNYAARPLAGLFHRLPRISDLTPIGVNLILIHRLPPPKFLSCIQDSGSKVVFLVHGISLEEGAHSSVVFRGSKLGLKIYLRTQSARLNSGSIYFQVLTERLGAFLAREGIDPERICVIPNGLPLDEYRVAPSQYFDVIFLGRIERFVKGIDLLARILDRLDPVMPPDMTVTVVGSGADDAFLRRRAVSKWKSGRIRLRGFVSESEKKELLSRASVMLITSRAEAFSLAALEGLGSGVPVFSTPASGPMSVISRQPEFGKVLKPRPFEFLEAILVNYTAWRQDPRRYLDEREIRRKNACSLFCESKMVSSYASMISKIGEE